MVFVADNAPEYDTADALAFRLEELAEGQTLEGKRATGRDGRGEVPRSFYETYPAMANTSGGVVLLGIEERPIGVFTAIGIAEPERVRTDLWNGLNDKQQISHNLLTDAEVTVESIDGKSIIKVRVPRASRLQRPVYVGRNPFEGTFRRNHSGDYRCDEAAVRRIIDESASETRDGRVLEHTTLDDIDPKSIQAYRTLFRDSRPGHPWLEEDDRELLRKLGGWARDREGGFEGLTLAGLLMFGRLRSILDFVPTYVVDYHRIDRTGQSRQPAVAASLPDGQAQLDLFCPVPTGRSNVRIPSSTGPADSPTGEPPISTESDGSSTGDSSSSTYTDRPPRVRVEGWSSMIELARPVRDRRAASQTAVRALILRLCAETYLTTAELGRLLNRNPNGLREAYLPPLVREGALMLRYPDRPSHPDQAYATADAERAGGSRL